MLRPDGYFFFFDRVTGKPILPVEERPVPQDAIQKTSPTQPFPIGGESVLPPCSFWKDKIPAGFVLGCGFTPKSVAVPNLLAQPPNVKIVTMSYSPNTGYFYAQAIARLAWSRRSEDPYFLAPEGNVPGLTRLAILAAVDSRTGKIAWKKEMPPTVLGLGGTLSSAGGLLFRLGGDGKFNAYDERSGEPLWEFQTGILGGAGTPASYELDGEQYIAVPVGPVVWTFKLGGSMLPRPAVPLPVPSADPFAGPIQDTWQIETTSLTRDVNTTGQKYYIDEYAFNPYRARVTPGQRVTWVNNGSVVHTIQELNGAWTTGPMNPGALGFVSFPTPGRYTYICKEHPWAYGQIIVQDAQALTGTYTEAQAGRGRAGYAQNCGTCHGDNLAGRDPAPALVGPGFMARWGSRNIVDLFERVRTTMPPTNPGGLSDQAYLDIVSFMLQSNDLPPGNVELTSSSGALKSAVNGR